MYCLNFRVKIDLDISYESSTSRQFTWNVVPYLIPRTATNFKSAVCFLWACESNRVSFNYCIRNVWFILQAQCKNMDIFLHRGHTIRLYAAGYMWRLKPPNTEPNICDLWHAKSSYFRSTDTLRLQWPFPLQTGRRCFPLAVEYLNPIRINHVTLWWAADNRCARARESVCPWSCSNRSISLPPGKFCLPYCRLLIFFKITFLKKSFKNTIRVANSLDPGQARRLNCLQ